MPAVHAQQQRQRHRQHRGAENRRSVLACLSGILQQNSPPRRWGHRAFGASAKCLSIDINRLIERLKVGIVLSVYCRISPGSRFCSGA
tara:strand:- start:9136 stop:9399 length:264 start_codon:yes stop_codon:yes gene_type:complete